MGRCLLWWDIWHLKIPEHENLLWVGSGHLNFLLVFEAKFLSQCVSDPGKNWSHLNLCCYSVNWTNFTWSNFFQIKWEAPVFLNVYPSPQFNRALHSQNLVLLLQHRKHWPPSRKGLKAKRPISRGMWFQHSAVKSTRLNRVRNLLEVVWSQRGSLISKWKKWKFTLQKNFLRSSSYKVLNPITEQFWSQKGVF